MLGEGLERREVARKVEKIFLEGAPNAGALDPSRFEYHGWSGRVVLSSKLFQMAFGKTSRSRASALKRTLCLFQHL